MERPWTVYQPYNVGYHAEPYHEELPLKSVIGDRSPARLGQAFMKP